MTDQTHQIPTQLQTARTTAMQNLDQGTPRRHQCEGDRPRLRICVRNDKKLFSKFVTEHLDAANSISPALTDQAEDAMPKIDEFLARSCRKRAPTCIFSAAIRRASASSATC